MNWVKEFVKKFKMYISPLDPEARKKVDDHINIFIREEFEELVEAWQRGDMEEVVDALGDLSWHCDKAFEMLGIDGQEVRNEIGRANLSKELGIKPGREHATQDVIKPEGWVAPSHEGNHGVLDEIK